MYRVVVCMVFATGLSACSVSRPEETARVSLDQIVQAGPDKYRDSNASADAKIQQPAFASLPPEAGRIVRVSHKRSVEGVRQEIIYDQSAPGLEASGIDLRIRTSSAAALDEPLRMSKPTEAGIRSELSSQFPKMTMQVVDHPRSNAYGPYGLAVGRWANGTRCIYAWQWIDNLKSNLSSEGGPARSASGFAARTPRSISWQVMWMACRSIPIGSSRRPMPALARRKRYWRAFPSLSRNPRAFGRHSTAEPFAWLPSTRQFRNRSRAFANRHSIQAFPAPPIAGQ